jgi:hypothetical protein
MPSTLDDSAIQQALGGVPRTSMVDGDRRDNGAVLSSCRQTGRLDLSDLDQ